MNIQCTTDYSKFIHLTGNRPVDADRVKRIAKLMTEVGFIPGYHIVVSSKMEVLDGQHRLEAAKLATVPVHFVIDDGLEITTIQKAGSLSEKWSLNDHVTGRAEAGNPHYQALMLMIAKSRFIYSITFEIMARAHSSRMIFIRQVKDGTFETSAAFETKYEQICTRLADIDAVNGKFLENKYAVLGVLSLTQHPLYDHKRLKEKLEYQSTRLVRCVSPAEYTRLMFDIYNYKALAKNVIEPLDSFTKAKKVKR